MNYRHAFHAGNFADVHKHWVLSLVLTRLLAKDKPLFVLDSHAGAGFYDLSWAETGRTGEAADGIARLLETPIAGVEAYLDAVRAAGEGFYPGSPWMVARSLRRGDRLAAIEAQPEQARLLTETLHEFKNAKVYQRDGYGEIPSHLPPKERRGFVLIDPPYETRDDVPKIAKAVTDGLKRFENAVFLIWYPIKTHALGNSLVASLPAAKGRLRSELWVTAPDKDDAGLTGSGLILLNPPYTVEDSIREVSPTLAECLKQDDDAGWRLESF